MTNVLMCKSKQKIASHVHSGRRKKVLPDTKVGKPRTTAQLTMLETAGTTEIFVRFIQKRKLRYTIFIGDDDSSPYPSVVQADPYPGTVVEKGECIVHVQKRVGTNLRKLRKEVLKERKKLIFGRGKMNDLAINYIQNCYGLAIRQNTNSLYQMKKNVSSIMFHCSDISPDEERHKARIHGVPIRIRQKK